LVLHSDCSVKMVSRQRYSYSYSFIQPNNSENYSYSSE